MIEGGGAWEWNWISGRRLARFATSCGSGWRRTVPQISPGVDVRARRFGEVPGFADWTEKLHEAGYLCVAWPDGFGGRGLTGVEVAVMNEEFARAGVPRVTRGMGEWLVGPSIIVWGTDEQKAHFLPRIIEGKDRYCQGFSEPDAGSDLASLKTRAIVDGDEVVITGQKVWTSGALFANMMFCLCRTDPDAPKHRGISYVLTPMYRENGELQRVRPTADQAAERRRRSSPRRSSPRHGLPLCNVIGGLNNGWRVTMTTLGNERGGNATTQHVQYAKQFWDAVEMTRELGKSARPARAPAAGLGLHALRDHALPRSAASSPTCSLEKEPGPASALNKMFWSEYAQRFAENITNWRGMASTVLPEDGSGDYPLDKWQQAFLSTRSATIWGGTAQVQRNIVSERVLGMPKEPGSGD